MKILERRRNYGRPAAPPADGISPFWPRFRYYSLLAFLIACLIGGGASRADVLSLLYLRPLAILCLAGLLLSPGAWQFRRFGVLFLLLGLVAATMVIQLIPLPPGLWLTLPGHDRFAEAAAAGGFDQPWRPISLSPDHTLNSLLALLPCLVVLVGFAGIEDERRRNLLLVLIGFVGIDAVWSTFQFVGGPESASYLYRITNNGDPVGLFSNRNHHAMFLTLGFPMLAAWLHTPSRDRERARVRFGIAMAVALFLIAAILAAGSRAGVLLGAVAIMLTLPLLPRPRSVLSRGRRMLMWGVLGLIPLLLILLTMFANRAPALQHLVGTHLVDDQRALAFPTIWTMAGEFAPWGIGFGAFDPVYRGFEPDSLLGPEYMNHAHNDLVELILTGGIPALIILGAFVAWFVWVGVRPLFHRRNESDKPVKMLAVTIILIILAASLADYPLRTPLISVVFTIACGWLSLPARHPAGTDSHAKPERDPAPAVRGSLLPAAARIGATLLGTTGLLWVALGVTASFALMPMGAEAVARWWPFDAGVQATLAANGLNPRDRSAVQSALEHARTALIREPVNVEAARTAGLVAALGGDMPRAQRLISYSERLSRRDAPTQLWLIEDSVRRNDIAGALVHYDRVLRTSPGSQNLLFPILMQAAESPEISPALARVLAGRPSWWHDFMRHMVVEGRSADAIELSVRAVRIDVGDAEEAELLSAAIAREIQLGGNNNALRLYAHFSGGVSSLVRNGDFERENRFPPLDWSLGDQDDLSAFVGTRPGGGQALMLVSRNGTGGEVARQLLMLPPGQYRIGLVAGDVSGTAPERPKISILCNPSSAPLLDAPLADAPSSGTAQGFQIVVPVTGCGAQWLIVTARGANSDSGNTAWIDNVTISR